MVERRHILRNLLLQGKEVEWYSGEAMHIVTVKYIFTDGSVQFWLRPDLLETAYPGSIVWLDLNFIDVYKFIDKEF